MKHLIFSKQGVKWSLYYELGVKAASRLTPSILYQHGAKWNELHSSQVKIVKNIYAISPIN